MSYYEQDYRRRLHIGRENNSLIALVAINLTVYVIFAFIKVVYIFTKIPDEFFLKNVFNWFAMPAGFEAFMTRPWTLITHMFLHDSVWRVLANMLWLWAFGYIMQDLTGNRKIVAIYIYGCIAGAIAFMMAYNFIPSLKANITTATAFGASAGIMAVAVSTTMVAPDFRLFPMLNGGIPLWVLTLLFVIIDLSSIPTTNTAEYFSHVAGGAMGFFFIFLLRRGFDWSEWMNNFFDWIGNLFNPDKPKRGKNIRTEVFYKKTRQPYKKTPNITQQRIDEILDKINQKGYHFLTDEEKELLKRASEEDLK
ncbi:MAG: rhomboid family intramembrane serine protease [Bacteroidetes bacterium]|nr:rhomboid family intramembrane serine protease [Bacteroidota bacterium]MBS1607417.1 rhomboid family intramembrane serine protease [Bacteroidota bacterium]